MDNSLIGTGLRLKLTLELAVVQAYAQAFVVFFVTAGDQQHLAHLRQQRIGKDGVDHTAPGFYLSTALNDKVDHAVIDFRSDAVVLLKTSLNALQL